MRYLFIALLLCLFLLSFACTSGPTESPAVDPNATSAFADISDARQALAVGDDLFEKNETERAIDAFLRAVELDPELAEGWFKLGIAYSLIEKERALAAETGVKVPGDAAKEGVEKPDSEKAFKKAIEAYKRLLSANPDNDVAHFNLGRAYNKLDLDEEAARSLRQAVRIKPDDTEYQTELGAILIKLAEYREAIPPLKKALELDPENSRAIALLEDAEAGRSRVDYVGEKKAANANANANANSNANSSLDATSANSDRPPAATNVATPKRPEIKDKPTPKQVATPK